MSTSRLPRTLVRAAATTAVAAAVVAAAPHAPATAAAKSPSTVTIRADGVELFGTVSSPNRRCEGNRTVVVYKVVGTRGGGDDPVIGSDTTSVRNGVGVWNTGNTGFEGRFWARVVATPRCQGDTSPTIRAVR